MLPVGCHSEALVDPHIVVRGGEGGYCQAVVPVQVVCTGACRVEQQSGLTLVREHSKPVGSGFAPFKSGATCLPALLSSSPFAISILSNVLKLA